MGRKIAAALGLLLVAWLLEFGWNLVTAEPVELSKDDAAKGIAEQNEGVAGEIAPDPGVQVPVSDGALLVDVSAETYGGLVDPIFPVGTRLPATRERIYTTTEDDQTSLEISVLQGFRPLARGNLSLVKLQILDLQAALRGVPKIVTRFTLDRTGRLTVSATDESNGRRATVSVQASNVLTPEQLRELRNLAAAHRDGDASQVRVITTRYQAELMLYVAQRQILEAAPGLAGPGRKRVLDQMAAVERHIADPAPDRLAESMNELQSQIERLTGQRYVRERGIFAERSSGPEDPPPKSS